MSFLFRDINFNQDISNWDTSQVTNMMGMFYNAISFNKDINTKQVTVNGKTYKAWDTSKVRNMHRMFFYAKSFKGNISNWDTSQVIDMSYIFKGASSFDIKR